MKQEKKVNSYLRAIKIIALACVIGGVIGGVTGAIRFVLLSRGVAVSGDWVVQQIRSLLVPILGIIFAVTVILEELCFHKLKGICEKQITAEDEECDQLEYEEEKTGAFGTNLNVLSQVVSIFFLILLDSFVNVFTTAVNYILNERRVCGKVRIKHVHAIDDFVCEIAVSRYSKLLDIIFHIVKSIEEQICDLTISKVCVYLRKDFVQKLVKLNKTELLGFGYDL